MRLLMLSGDEQVAAGERCPFHALLSEFRRHFEGVDVLVTGGGSSGHPGGAVQAFCALGEHVFTGGAAGTIRVWKGEATGFMGVSELAGHTAAIRSLETVEVCVGYCCFDCC